MRLAPITASFLAFWALTGCTAGGSIPSPTDDDAATPDPADDDTATPSPDDDTDDDAANDDTADDDTTPEPTPIPPTFVEILTPGEGVLSLLEPVSVRADGEAPGYVRLSLDGTIVATLSFDESTGEAAHVLDTGMVDDGAYILRAELLDGGLFDEVAVQIANGDLLLYPLGALTLDSEGWPWLGHGTTSDTVSITAQVSIDDALSFPWLGCYIRDPNNQWAVTETFMIPGAGASPYAGTIPNHPNAPLLTGDYRFYPAADVSLDGTNVEVEVLLKRGPQAPEAGRIALDLHFTPGSGLSAVSAATDGALAQLIDDIESIWLQADIVIGEVRYFDVPDTAFDSIATYEELWDLFGSPPESTDRTLPVFFVDDLAFANVLGIAAHLPGPTLRNGTRQAGVAMESDQLLSGAVGAMAGVAAHEMGHFLGLFHPTEIGQVAEDPLLDTAPCCDAGSCWATNLMDPYAWGNTTLTADQRFVALRHPVVVPIDPSELPAARSVPFIPVELDPGLACAGRGDGRPAGGLVAPW